MATATASDYAQLQKDYNKDARGVSEWERYFYQPLQQTYQTKTALNTASASYDISDAYSNYKKQQTHLLQQQHLGSGFKEKIAEGMFGNYQTTHNDILWKYSDSANKINEEYKKALDTNEAALLETGQKFKDIENKIYEFAGVDASKLDVSKESGGLGYYATNPETGMRELTEDGQEFFKQMLLSDVEGKGFFSKYLEEQDSDLYNFYTDNPVLVKEFIGGIDKDTTTYDAYELKGKRAYEEYTSKYETRDREFASNKDKYTYYNNMNSMDESAYDINEYSKDKDIAAFNTTFKDTAKIAIPDNIKYTVDDTKKHSQHSSGAHFAGHTTDIVIDIASLTPEQYNKLKEYNLTTSTGFKEKGKLRLTLYAGSNKDDKNYYKNSGGYAHYSEFLQIMEAL